MKDFELPKDLINFRCRAFYLFSHLFWHYLHDEVNDIDSEYNFNFSFKFTDGDCHRTFGSIARSKNYLCDVEMSEPNEVQ